VDWHWLCYNNWLGRGERETWGVKKEKKRKEKHKGKEQKWKKEGVKEGKQFANFCDQVYGIGAPCLRFLY
jgi:hypothetical protein